MNYEVVQLKEKLVVGLEARTNNNDKNMGSIIGGLWQRFYSKDVYFAIENKSTDKSLGIYTDYAGNEKDDYTVVVACEVEKAENVQKDIIARKIPAGKYAKFIVIGDMREAVAAAWQKIWQMDLNRSFVCDFEEYQNADMENAEIHIYIGLK